MVFGKYVIFIFFLYHELFLFLLLFLQFYRIVLHENENIKCDSTSYLHLDSYYSTNTS